MFKPDLNYVSTRGIKAPIPMPGTDIEHFHKCAVINGYHPCHGCPTDTDGSRLCTAASLRPENYREWYDEQYNEYQRRNSGRRGRVVELGGTT
jgi:hypothetical protein